jgi:two-component system response regulator VicR
MENKKKILIVEDEKNIAEVLAYNIKRAGYETECVYDGLSAVDEALKGGYDLVLLDIMLPKLDGFAVCEKIRAKSSVPIIFVTAREDEKDKILGLDTGADDYVTKPFSLKELLSRIRANIRRSTTEAVAESAPQKKQEPIRVGELVIDLDRYSVTKAGEPLELSKKDYDLLVFFAKNVGKAFTREQLLENVWGYDGYLGDIRTVDVAIKRLRSKIEPGATKYEYIMTKQKVGYYLRDF